MDGAHQSIDISIFQLFYLETFYIVVWLNLKYPNFYSLKGKNDMEAVQIESKKGPPRSDSQKLIDEDAESVGKIDRKDRLNKVILFLISYERCSSVKDKIIICSVPEPRVPEPWILELQP